MSQVCTPIVHDESKWENLTSLLSTSDDIHLVNADGENAVHLACQAGNMVFVKILVKYDCKYDQRDNNGKLPIDKIYLKETKIEFLGIIDCLQLR